MENYSQWKFTIPFYGRFFLDAFLCLLITIVSTTSGNLLMDLDNVTNSVQIPVSYLASSSRRGYEANQASGSVFDSKTDDNPRAWCPSLRVKDETREWLQLTFDEVKVIKVLLTWGLNSNRNEYVPYFLVSYEREEDRWHRYIRSDGSELIEANKPEQPTKTIYLDPPITARRIRIIPYRKAYAQHMCLKLTVVGHPFGVPFLSYEIPEGDTYRLPISTDTRTVLNDTSYDGYRIAPISSSSREDTYQRAVLTGGLGVLVDRRVFLGESIRAALEDSYFQKPVGNKTATGLVGWFCRSGLPLTATAPTCQSRSITLMFTFNSTRKFTDLRIHALDSFAENIAVFREALVQFSIGGRHFDRYGPPVTYKHQRNVTSSQARWVIISLNRRVGRYVRVKLTFYSDWIILSEVTFNSTPWTVDIGEESDEVPFHQKTSQAAAIQPEITTENRNSSTLPSSYQFTDPVDFVKVPTFQPVSHPPPAAPVEDPTDLSLIISIACVVGLIIVIAIFVYVVCRLCRSSHVNRALLNKVEGRSSSGIVINSAAMGVDNSQKNLNAVYGTEVGGGEEGSNSRLLARTSHTSGASAGYCLANSMTGNEVTATKNHVDIYSAFGGRDGILYQPFHVIQYDSAIHQPNQQSTVSSFGTLPALSHRPTVASAAPVTTGSPYYPPPPPDQPLPPLPPVTPTSGMNCYQARPSSLVNPYAASSAVSMPLSTGNGFNMTSSTHTEGSMAEYASASLINGQSGYLMRPTSINCGSGRSFAPSGPYTLPPCGQQSIFPLIVSCPNNQSNLIDPGMVSLAYLPQATTLGAKSPFDTLKSIETLPPHEEMR